MNKNVKRIFLAFLCVIMIFSLFTVTGFAEENTPAIRLSVDSENLAENVVRLLVSLENMPEFTTADINVSFDSTSLDCDGFNNPKESNIFSWAGGVHEDGLATCFIMAEDETVFQGQLAVAEVIFNVINTDNITVKVSIDNIDCLPVPENAEIDVINLDTFDPCKAGFEYNIVDGKAVITGYSMKSTENVVIPSEFEGYPVTEIAPNAFAHCSKIKSVVVPEGVTKIGYSAFTSCRQLREISLPETLVTIENSAFYGCFFLDNVVIPDSITEIAEYTFSECEKLKNVTLSKNLKTIGLSAFSVSGLENVDIPQSVTSIMDGAFAGTNLKKVVIPYGIKSINHSTFANCKKLTEVVIPETVESIGRHVFFGCSAMKSIKIPASVKEIGYRSVGYERDPFPMGEFVIYGVKGSAAESYALSNRINFVDINPVEVLYDVNGDGNITAADARLALRASARLATLGGDSFTAADVNHDGNVTASDARLILRKSAKLD